MILPSLLLGLIETALNFGVVACGFYMASIATRHFAFASAASFVLAPAIGFALQSYGMPVATAVGLVACAAIGALYCRGMQLIENGGARSGQLLIVSLAAMMILENLIALRFGSASWSLQPDPVVAEGNQFGILAYGSAILFSCILAWHHTIYGKVLTALIESPLNLSLLGYRVIRIEVLLAAIGFGLIGVAGILWAQDGRVKPSMCTEIGITGAVAAIVGPILYPGAVGLILAGMALAIGRIVLSVTLQGNWSMTAMLVLLLMAIAIRRRRGPQWERSK